MTFAGSFPHRLTRVDDLTRSDHWYLTVDDKCYFIGEYTARKGYAFSDTNNLILNFKKPVDRRGRPEWRYKECAIRQAAAAFRQGLNPAALEHLTFIPIPPSKAEGDPLHDDRMTRMLGAIQDRPPLDIREMIVQTESVEAVHSRDERPRPEEIAALYRIEEGLCAPAPRIIAVVDDLLTTGAHFRAAHSLLSERFPNVKVIGLFIARRIPNTADLNEFTDAG